LASQVIQAYQSFSAAARNDFFDLLLEEYGPDHGQIVSAAQAYQQKPGFETHRALARAVETPRERLFQCLNLPAGGTSALVRMREDLLQQSTPRRVLLRGVEHDLRHLLQSWFNRGFLACRRIDWDSPASLLEKIINYEAVHEIRGWGDLRRRLEGDRRCFAFFHPSMIDEPLVFVEIALTGGIPRAIGPLLASDAEVGDEHQANTAVFYSISNCQTGLRNISFGGFLIKQVVDELRRELDQLQTFVTLSPLPRFRAWLSQQGETGGKADHVGRLAADIHRCLEDRPLWFQDDELRENLRAPLVHLGAHFLLHARLDELPVDPVARFHLGNGASLLQINWLADTSDRGLAQSAGLMVNYHYELDRIEANHEQFVKRGTVVAADTIHDLANELAGETRSG
jgi:malonyl-CoA decarboxylase